MPAIDRTNPWWSRGLVLATVVFWTVLIVATHAPRVPEVVAVEPTDKIAHLAGYGILGFLVGATWSLWYRLSWLAATGLLVLIAAHAALDEATQPMFGRYADITDWYADVLGAAAGLATAALFSKLTRKRTSE